MNANIENVVLVYVELPGSNPQQDLYELEELIGTAHGKITLKCCQKRNTADPCTVVGKGKLEEIKSAMEASEEKADVVIFSCTLNATQRATLQKTLGCDVIDKFDLILDIFALRAASAEGKKQVELAQLSYNLATKTEGDFSRQGAGIGTRGPGETKLETNKRVARERIYRLRKELAEIEKRREITRQNRHKNDKYTVALVGYTNAGKSTLFNALTDASVYADDKLFATLDTTVRKLTFENGIEVLLCDTVGFINDLPHSLLNAFKSTLEEAKSADLLLNVCDVSNPDVVNHIEVTEKTLAELGVSAPIIRVYNKCDKLTGAERLYALTCDGTSSIFVSAKNGRNTDVLLNKIKSFAMDQYSTLKLKMDHSVIAGYLPLLDKYAARYKIDYMDDGVIVEVIVSKKYVNLFSSFIVF